MTSEVVLMPESAEVPPAAPNAFASFYALSPAGRVAAAVRLVRILKRSRRRRIDRMVRSMELDCLWGCEGGRTDDRENEVLSLTQLVLWLEVRYGLRGTAGSPALLAHVRREFETDLPEERSSVPRTRQLSEW